MSGIYKAKMTKTYTFFVEAEDEDQLLKWMATHDIGDVADRTPDYSVEDEDEVICAVNGYADFSIVGEEVDDDE